MKKMATAFAICATLLLTACAGSSPNGYSKTYTPTTDLEKIKADFDKNNVPSGIGIGQSTDEMIARTQSIDEAQTAIQLSIKNLIIHFKDQYAENADNESTRSWEDMSVTYALGEIQGIIIYKTITQFSETEGMYKVYSIAAMNPNIIGAAMQKATDELSTEETFKLKIDTQRMHMDLEKAANQYQLMLEHKE